MASTREGANIAPKGDPRTFPWCQITLDKPNSTGVVGYSVCMIDQDDNEIGGSWAGTFYDSNRVIDYDAFYVQITP
jgi:hypothetical protein